MKIWCLSILFLNRYVSALYLIANPDGLQIQKNLTYTLSYAHAWKPR